jgi:hypothetical protein
MKEIKYNELMKRNEYKKQLLKAGFKFINKTNRYKRIIAFGFIIVGCLTLPFPTGSIMLILLGLGMLGLRKEDLKRYYKLILYKRKAKRGNKIK